MLVVSKSVCVQDFPHRREQVSLFACHASKQEAIPDPSHLVLISIYQNLNKIW